jgi:hypothetical protein
MEEPDLVEGVVGGMVSTMRIPPQIERAKFDILKDRRADQLIIGVLK